MRCTSDRLCPWRHWKMALCSESTGKSGTRRSRAAWVMRGPAITSVSLLASAIALPDWMAAIVGRSPAPPTMPERTTSASTCEASVTSPDAPEKISGRGCGSARTTASTARESVIARARGRCFRHRSAMSSGLEPRAASPSTRNRVGNWSTSSSVRRPMEPVAPRRMTRFMRRPAGRRRRSRTARER